MEASWRVSEGHPGVLLRMSYFWDHVSGPGFLGSRVLCHMPKPPLLKNVLHFEFFAILGSRSMQLQARLSGDARSLWAWSLGCQVFSELRIATIQALEAELVPMSSTWVLPHWVLLTALRACGPPNAEADVACMMVPP